MTILVLKLLHPTQFISCTEKVWELKHFGNSKMELTIKTSKKQKSPMPPFCYKILSCPIIVQHVQQYPIIMYNIVKTQRKEYSSDKTDLIGPYNIIRQWYKKNIKKLDILKVFALYLLMWSYSHPKGVSYHNHYRRAPLQILHNVTSIYSSRSIFQ